MKFLAKLDFSGTWCIQLQSFDISSVDTLLRENTNFSMKCVNLFTNAR
jgi:hypothetical protein